MLKKIGLKIFFLLVLVLALNVIYHFTFFDKDLEEFAPEDLEIRNDKSMSDIYYFGESSNVTYKKEDSTQKSISELCAMFYPQLHLKNINKYATHAGVYKHWLRLILSKKQKPKAIIVTLNLRSFDATWINSKLETQLQRSMVLCQDYPKIINRFLLSLQAFDNKTEEQREKDMLEEWQINALQFPYAFKYKTTKEWDSAMAYGGHVDVEGKWDTKKIELSCHYIKSYAFNLNVKNPRIKDFDEISQMCKNSNVKLYLNLMAENIQYADSLVGKDLVLLMRQNRDFLLQRYQNTNCMVVDNLELVLGSEFIDQNWTTEHYNDKGRMRIAKNVAERLKIQFNKEYIKAY